METEWFCSVLVVFLGIVSGVLYVGCCFEDLGGLDNTESDEEAVGPEAEVDLELDVVFVDAILPQNTLNPPYTPNQMHNHSYCRKSIEINEAFSDHLRSL